MYMVSGEYESGFFEDTPYPPRNGEFMLGLGEAAMLDSGSDVMEEIRAENPQIEIREEQIEALDAIQAARLEGRDRTLLQMATGLGKTLVAAADVKRFLAERPEARILFLCHQNDILDQAQAIFEQVVGSEHTYGKFTGETKDYHEVDCLFASFDAMRNNRELFFRDEFDYVAVDESHHAKAPTYEPTLDYFQPDFMLGITATPDRHDLKNIREIFGNEVYALSLEEAIARELLATVDYQVMTDDIADTQTIFDQLGRKHSYKQLDRLIFIPKRDQEIARIIHEQSEKTTGPTKRIIFCRSIQQAQMFAQYFEKGAPTHSELPREQQKQLLEAFRNGSIDTLLTVDKFNEGIDLPDANQIVFLRKTRDKTNVQVLDFVANCDRLVMLDQLWADIRQYTHARRPSEPYDLTAVNAGTLTFNDSERDVLELLAEIEQHSRFYERWSPDDSKRVYYNLSESLDHLPTVDDLTEYCKQDKNLPSIFVVLRPFDRSIIKLREACGMPQLVETQSLSSFSATHFVTRATTQGLVEKLGLGTQTINVYGRDVLGLPAETQAALLEQFPFNTPRIEPTDIPLNDSVKLFGKDRGTIVKTMELYGLELRQVRRHGQACKVMSTESRDRLVKIFNDNYVEAAPDDIVSLHRIAKKLGLSQKTLKPILNDHGFIGKNYTFGQIVATGFTTEERSAIEGLPELAKYIKQDVTSVKVLAKELGVDPTRIQGMLTANNLESGQYQFGGSKGRGVTTEVAEVLRTLVAGLPPIAPEGVLSLSALSEQNHLNFHRVKRALGELGITGKIFRFGARTARGFTQAEISLVKHKLNS
jgi:superfamily II DNA or RNA helicase